MMKDFGPKTYVYPMPVFIIASYDENGVPDAMNAAWGCIGDDDRLFLCLSPEHKTVKNILKRKAYTVSMATVEQEVACDFVGIVSANDVPDKFERAGFHAVKSDKVDAPLIRELPMAMECELISYDEEHCGMFGKIVNVCADESVLTDGKIDPKKLRPITYDPVNHKYYALGDVAGNAFSDGKKLR
jgi:flavin reductase (DIM6/NTAB) family NADH-FMN oxidoreductase RutF